MTTSRPAHTGLRLWLERHKPRGHRRTQLILAGSMWTAVGIMLCTLGTYWMVHGFGRLGFALIVPLVGAGYLQAHYILDRVADKAVRRIEERGDGRCLGGFLSARSWLLVLFMMALGQLLRASHLPRAHLGMVYVWIGSALLIASRRYWRGLYELSTATRSAGRPPTGP